MERWAGYRDRAPVEIAGRTSRENFPTDHWRLLGSQTARFGKDGGPTERVYLGQKDSIHDQIAWDFGDVHYFADAKDGGPLTCQYVFVLDALNFCFWPTPEYVSHIGADYRVPQVLRPEGVLQYSLALDALIQAKTPIPSGSLMEVEIRACTIQAVEQLHAVLTAKGHRIKVIELDWLLWQIGENAKDHLPNHHRTWSVFY
ncbi:hypothetical protein DYB38_007839 [Aphanomyces astaci]|uniref:Queuosine 5'-phosphate N-glycosylase/hydrolase n=1 Tax=Aphanomyces astaci TaxID=112090 RepID=A0A397DL00_APHAT|nr:hypothetical protein DYB38_007839 [Aphanomyces astaci]